MAHGRWRVLAAVLAVCGAAAGCTAGGDGRDDAAGGDRDGGSVIAPGEPGEPAETLSVEEAREAARSADSDPNAADRAFMARMVVHHEQAVTMAALAEEQAEDGDVRRLAERIVRAQEPEIEAMRAWLDVNGDGDTGRGDGEGTHGHEDMPGMASQEELARLRAARGGEFDRLFLELMIAHHEGGVAMANDEVARGRDEFVVGLATELASTQGPEIDRLEDLLDDLTG